MKNAKKILILAVVLSVLCALMCVNAFAAEEPTINEIVKKVDNVKFSYGENAVNFDMTYTGAEDGMFLVLVLGKDTAYDEETGNFAPQAKDILYANQTTSSGGKVSFTADADNVIYPRGIENESYVCLAGTGLNKITLLGVITANEPAPHVCQWETKWSYDGTYHWKACTDKTCDKVNEKDTHTWDAGEITTQPTETSTGVRTYTCTANCGATKTEVIPKLPSAVITPVGPSKDEVEDKDDEGETDVTVGKNFSDVKPADWFYGTVEYVVENGLMNGTSDTSFAPYADTTRAMIVTILWRLEGEPAPLGNCQFVDVPTGAWYTDAVTWAAEKGIVTGISATEFMPEQNITREQFATILWRYAKNYKGYDVSVGEDTNILSYTDAFNVSEYAIPAMQWACGAGLINGIDGALQPAGFANRAQAATILARFCQNVE